MYIDRFFWTYKKEKYVHIKIKDADQFIPLDKANYRIQPLSEEMKQNHNFEIGKIVKNTFHGFENIILNTTNNFKKIFFIN